MAMGQWVSTMRGLRMPLRSFSCTFALLCNIGASLAQLMPTAVRNALLMGDVDATLQWVDHRLHSPDAGDALTRARLLELAGEQYHRLSDIGEAKKYWDGALTLRQRTFGDSSAEAAVGYAYRARYHNYMAAYPPSLIIFGLMRPRPATFGFALAVAVSLHGQPLLERARIGMLNGRIQETLVALDSAIEATAQPSLAYCRLLETKGEVFHRLSDIGGAQRCWNEALGLRRELFGDSSAEAAVGYAYQARYHNYMAAPLADHQPLAWREASRARRLLQHGRGKVSPGERILILREGGYAYKVAFGRSGLDKHTLFGRSRQLYRDALRAAINVRDTIWIAQVMHDIGNTFTDETGLYAPGLTRAQLRPYVDSALHYYDASRALMQRHGMGMSEAVMMDHFTTALVLKGAYGKDSLDVTLAAFDRALRTMLMQEGQPADVDPFLFDPRLRNKAQMVELYYQRATAIAMTSYPQEPDVAHVRAALTTVEAAVPYWEAMLREYEGRDLHKVVGAYGHFPFQLGTRLAADLFHTTGDTIQLLKALQWFDRNRDALDQREVLRTGQRPEALVAQPSTLASYRAQPGTYCIAAHGAYHLDLFGIGPARNAPILFTLSNALTVQVLRARDELRKAMQANDPVRYRATAFLLYQALIAPLSIDADVQELVIIPGEVLDGIPFEALVTDTLGEATWGGSHYLGERFTIRYARTIREGIRAPLVLGNTLPRMAIAHPPGMSELPFADSLVRASTQWNGSPAPAFHVTRQDLLNLLAQDAPLHLASHAIHTRRPDDLPYLVLQDGPLSLGALDSATCRSPFVALSTCSSGEGPTFSGQATLSLGNALLRRGAGAVVQTLWPVDDRATSEVLGLMYGNMREGRSVSEALAAAKRDFIQRHKHDGLASPYYWSGIVLTGRDVRSVATTGSIRWWVAGGLVALFGSLLGYGSFKRSRRSRARTAS